MVVLGQLNGIDLFLHLRHIFVGKIDRLMSQNDGLGIQQVDGIDKGAGDLVRHVG